MKTFYSTCTQRSLTPRGYLKIEAESEEIARIVSAVELGKDWAFIYNDEEQFQQQIQRHHLYPIEKSPIKVEESEEWSWRETLKQRQERTRNLNNI